MRKKYFWYVYLFFDFISAGLSWIIFNYFRKTYIEKFEFEISKKLIISTFLISLLWIILYAILGNYKNVYKKYRLKEITQITSQTFIGIILIFFILIC